ncbi:helix-turn-helix transcriptional regulator [Haloarchaeobius sp. DYHT-AS-18]|uniref:helix-turn-helix transcriptional regulator n=1 Tax=Haloarchaeobius sp. DYHT-AS-18 TaxID=3446117 RepID=UPI003EC0C170
MTQSNNRTPNDQTGSPHPPFEDIVVSLSKTGDLLTTLRDGPAGKAELASDLGVSKSTVYNWTTELEDLGICERTADGYAITRTGRAHLRLYRDFEDLSRRVYRDNELLDELPEDCVPPTPVLMDTTVTTSEHDPYALAEQFTTAVRDAGQVSCLLPAACSPILSAFSRRLDAGGFDLELVVEPPVCEYIESTHPEFCRALADADGSALVETTATIAVALCVYDGEPSGFVLATCNDHGYLTGVITADSNGAYEWASDLYDQYRVAGDSMDTP